jgi:hypothetical protein
LLDLGPNDPAVSYPLVIVVAAAVMAAAVMVAAIVVVMVTLPTGSLLPLAMVLAPMETVMPAGPTSERHAPE